MKLFQSLFTVMMVATISFSTFASSNNDDWELIATKTVNFQTETDTVTPNSLLKNRNFSKIKIKCIQGTVDLKDIKVTMTDGSEKKTHINGHAHQRNVNASLDTTWSGGRET